MTTRSPTLQRGDLRADRLDDAHRLVAEHVARVQEGASTVYRCRSEPHRPVRGDADDDVGGVLDRGVGDLVDADVADALPGESFHARSLPRRGSRKRLWI